MSTIKIAKTLLTALFIANFMLVLTLNTYANPAFPHVVTYKQSNGKLISYLIYGDEHVSWAKTLDGYMIMPLDNGDFVYAVMDNQGNMVPSQILASNTELRNNKEKSFLSKMDKNVFYSTDQIKSLSQKRFQRDYLNKAIPLKKFTTNKPKLMVVLVNYADIAISDENAERFKHQIQDSNYTEYGYTGSVRDYFADQSFGTIDPQFEVFGPITLPHNRVYYAGNNNDKAWEMARDAVKIIDTMYNVNFAEYDNNSDGTVDLVHIIYAGIGSNSTNQKNSQVWPHMFYFRDQTTLDGRKFYRYACSSELTLRQNGWSYDEEIDGIGAVCHEMGHAFGLPDMYATDYSKVVTPGSWDVMDVGSYNNESKTPPFYSMIERDMIGWGNLVDLTEGEHRIHPISTNDTAYKIHLNKDEYLVFEYRDHDKWDAFTKGVGMLVWHADTSKFVNWEMHNAVNNDADDRGCYIVCAGDESNLESNSTPYPGSLGVDKIDYFRFTDGSEIDGHIYNIHYDVANDSTLVFNYSKFYDVKFGLNVTNTEMKSIHIDGTFVSDKVISERKFQYKKSTQSNYQSVDLSSDNISYTVNNLEPNTEYKIRLSAKAGGITYYSPAKLVRTACYDGLISELSWEEGFENGLNCWTQQTSNGTVWKKVKTGMAGKIKPKKGFHMVALKFTQSSNTQSARLVSPVFDLSNYENVKLTFSYAIYSGAQSAPLTVYYRTSSMDTWKTLSTYANTNTSSSINWKNAEVLLKDLNSSYQFCFVGKDNVGYGVLLDAIKLDGKKKSALNDAKESVSMLSIVPNPSNNDAILQFTGLKEKTKVTVTDIMGRIVEQIELKDSDSQVNLASSSYESGIYYVTVSSGDNLIVKKFIKQ